MVLRWPRAARPPRHTRPRLGAAARRSGGHPRRDHAGLPAYIAMFVGGEWITSKEGLGGEDDPAWFVIGIVGGDLTGLLLAVRSCWRGLPRGSRTRAPRPSCGGAFRVRAGRMCGRRLGDDGQAHLAKSSTD